MFSEGGEEEEDEAYGGADEGSGAVAAQCQAAAPREGRSAEGTGESYWLYWAIG